MGNLYDYFAALVGYDPTVTQSPEILTCACIAAFVLFLVGVKLIFRGFDRLFGYNAIQ